jgi:magnesium-transporting ATPase (P-type)
MPYHKVLINLSKDVNIFKQETKNKKYFSNLFFLSIVFYFIFVFVLLYIDFIVGKNFFWFSQIQTMTRLFLDNFLLYIALLLGFFTSFVLYNIKNKNIYVFWRYIFIFFISTVVLFQVFVPNPDAQEVLIESINYLNENKEDLNLDTIVLNKVIAIKSISSKEIVENSFAEMVHFIPFEKKECGVDCAKYTILLEDPNFFNFEIQILEDNVYYIYYKKERNY